MNKRLICIIIAVVLIVIIATIAICIKNDPMRGKKVIKTPEGDIFVVFEDEEGNEENAENEEKNVFEYKDIDVPEDYTLIEEEKLDIETNMYIKAVAYHYDEKDNNTLVNVYLQNRGEKAFSKDAVCVISFLDKDGNLLERFGGVIEEDFNIPTGETTVVRTNFLQAPGEVASATIDFENVSYEDVDVEEKLIDVEQEVIDAE